MRSHKSSSKRAEALIDRKIDMAYRAKCCGIQINIMDIPKVFKHGRELLAQGADDAALADGIHAFVETLNQLRAT